MKTVARISSLLLCASSVVAAEKPMSFVVVMCDDIPPEYVGIYGDEKYPTPNLDRLAREGERFTSAFSTSPMCTPARFALLTGRWPGRCASSEFLNKFPDRSQPCSISWNTHITSVDTTLPRMLVEQGYNTGISGKWHLTDKASAPHIPLPENAMLKDPATLDVLKKQQLLDRQTVRDAAGFTHVRSVFLENCDDYPLTPYHNIPYITKGAVELLHEFAKDDKPFLLMTTPTGIHGPWLADVFNVDLRYTPGGYVEDVYDYAPDLDALKETVKDFSSGEKHKYVGMTELDHQLGVIRAELEKLGLAESTAVIFTADHGIEPGKASVYDRGMRVPLIVYWPGLTTPGAVSDSLVQHVDLTAAIAAAAGVPDIGGNMDGKDLRPVLADSNASTRDSAYFECGYSRGITDGRYKLVSIRLPESLIVECEAGEHEWLTVGMGAGAGAHAAFSQLAYPDYYKPDQLYDLKADPYEQKSVLGNPLCASVQKTLRTALTEITDSMPYAFPEAVQPFFATDTYKELTARTRRENNPFTKPWVKRDHDQIIWPPAD